MGCGCNGHYYYSGPHEERPFRINPTPGYSVHGYPRACSGHNGPDSNGYGFYPGSRGCHQHQSDFPPDACSAPILPLLWSKVIQVGTIIDADLHNELIDRIAREKKHWKKSLVTKTITAGTMSGAGPEEFVLSTKEVTLIKGVRVNGTALPTATRSVDRTIGTMASNGPETFPIPEREIDKNYFEVYSNGTRLRTNDEYSLKTTEMHGGVNIEGDGVLEVFASSHTAAGHSIRVTFRYTDRNYKLIKRTNTDDPANPFDEWCIRVDLNGTLTSGDVIEVDFEVDEEETILTDQRVIPGDIVENERIKVLRDQLLQSTLNDLDPAPSWNFSPELDDSELEDGDIIRRDQFNKLRDRVTQLQQTCSCNCNYCTCNCNYCTCNCNYSCTCNCNYSDKRLKKDIRFF